MERKYASSSVSLRLHAAGVERLCLFLGRGHAATARSQTHCAVVAVSVLGGAADAEVPDAPAPATADTHGSGELLALSDRPAEDPAALPHGEVAAGVVASSSGRAKTKADPGSRRLRGPQQCVVSMTSGSFGCSNCGSCWRRRDLRCY